MREKESIRWDNLEEWIRMVPNYAEEFVKKHEKEVYLYGGGRASYFYQKYLASKEIPVKGIIETNPAHSLFGGGRCLRRYIVLKNSSVWKEIAA